MNTFKKYLISVSAILLLWSGVASAEYQEGGRVFDGPIARGEYIYRGEIEVKGTATVAPNSNIKMVSLSGITFKEKGFKLSLKTTGKFQASIGDRNTDSDGDGLSDYDEIHRYKTDPMNRDTDGDGVTDGVEVQRAGDCGLDPLDDSDGELDCDGDGLSNSVEALLGTDVFDASSRPEPANYYQYDRLGRIKNIIRIQ